MRSARPGRALCALLLIVASITFLAAAKSALAHEVRPAYLQLRETRPGEFSVLWKTPMLGDARLSLAPEFTGDAEATTPTLVRLPPGAAVHEWTLRAPSLRGQSVRIRGLDATMTDALVRIEFLDGTTWTQRLTPGAASAIIPPRQSSMAVAGMYLRLGVEHIATGADHLLFVLALLLVTRSGSRLVKTVTAFTLAHSITLTAATLGLARVPQRPVEAVIALSIVFVAAEIVRGRDGHPGLTERAPWIVAFAFGLLHGFGFAGALKEIGLPQHDVPLALACFNVGVEIGQLAFILAAGLAWAAWRRIAERFSLAAPAWAWRVPPYGIGSVAAFWVIQRVAGF